MSIKPQIRTPLRTLLAALLLTLASAGLLTGAAQAQTPAASTPAPAATPAPATDSKPMPAAATETVENPYGIDALWKQGDFVSRGTLIILIIMSMGSWYIGIIKLIEQGKLLSQAKDAGEKFWKTNSIQDGIRTLHEDSAFRYIAEEGLKATDNHGSALLEQIDLNSWIGMAIQRAIDTIGNRLQGGLAFLATVGSTAPFVGLFGTVWGIYHALTAIGIAGQASIDKVAGPVGESLIMTAMGLAVAVPAVLGYNWLVRRNKVGMENVRHFSSELHMVLLSKGKTTAKAK
ncbi:MAG: MotA/TolQ/ExbB proton channel family protein [Proteobacteria bacterium]|nr:MotA/TolQ/ExbB proton channel family protein [Pseudomonadota bacterium]